MTAALIASSATLVAQDDERSYKGYLALGPTLAHSHAHDLTQTTWGGLGSYTAEFGLVFGIPGTNVAMRPNVGMARMMSKEPKEEDPTLYDMVGIYVGFDIVYSPFDKLPLSFSTGPSIHTWNVDEVNAFGDPNQHNKGMKLGWRLGTGYKITDTWSVTLHYTFTEWQGGGKAGTAFRFGYNPSRPCYFTVKCHYSF
jgi:hypothetical protein